MLLICKDKLLRNMSKRRSYDNNPQSTWLNFITPEKQSFLHRKSLFFPSKLTEFYLANQHVMKEIIIAKNRFKAL